SYSRGKIHVDDREAIERQACECYEVLRREFDCFRNEGAQEDSPRAYDSGILIKGRLRDSIIESL
ncbi:MAG: hypothetical protein LC672_03895, partial [Acidobacteria bacterium]|nr:hypothetical protein [Acidobacteriota bacterium]